MSKKNKISMTAPENFKRNFLQVPPLIKPIPMPKEKSIKTESCCTEKKM